ncbi:hypothetical protein [Litchfieldella qijiaojingensis]|uniref:hypothetical protein n=1 Tax=Litchfieldella qijiaojingensis TaxID=980347 RepID=UPI00167B2C88|nr:hypothetical protein [Halomonas qijiaojingensis]
MVHHGQPQSLIGTCGQGAGLEVATLFHVLEPGEVGVGLDHGVDGLADGLLIDLGHVGDDAFGGLDHPVALGDQLTLAQGFVGASFAPRRLPGEVAAALLVGFGVDVAGGFEVDGAAAGQRQVVTGFEAGALAGAVTS